MTDEQFNNLVAELQGNETMLRDFIQCSMDKSVNVKVLKVKRNRPTVIELNGLRYVLDPTSIKK